MLSIQRWLEWTMDFDWDYVILIHLKSQAPVFLYWTMDKSYKWHIYVYSYFKDIDTTLYSSMRHLKDNIVDGEQLINIYDRKYNIQTYRIKKIDWSNAIHLKLTREEIWGILRNASWSTRCTLIWDVYGNAIKGFSFVIGSILFYKFVMGAGNR